MSELLTELHELIKDKNPLHAKKLAKNPHFDQPEYQAWAEDFLGHYLRFLKNRDLSLDTASDYYLRVVNDTMHEQIQFFRSGEYSCKSFQDAYDRVYSRPEVMEYYMNGLLLTQVLWHHHYEVFQYFVKVIGSRRASTRRYLEIGGGHGAYVAEACRILDSDCYFEVVDISPTSLDMTKAMVDRSNVVFKLQDIYQYENLEARFDQIVLGEVLEHVETPTELLAAISRLVSPSGRLFLTTPINAPAIDHISLFRSPDELHDIFGEGGWRVEDELVLPTEEISMASALEKRIPIMYAASLEPIPAP